MALAFRKDHPSRLLDVFISCSINGQTWMNSISAIWAGTWSGLQKLST